MSWQPPKTGPRSLDPGLCRGCANAQVVTSGRGSSFWRCREHDRDPAWPKYPPLPVLRLFIQRRIAQLEGQTGQIGPRVGHGGPLRPAPGGRLGDERGGLFIQPRQQVGRAPPAVVLVRGADGDAGPLRQAARLAHHQARPWLGRADLVGVGQHHAALVGDQAVLAAGAEQEHEWHQRARATRTPRSSSGSTQVAAHERSLPHAPPPGQVDQSTRATPT